MSPQEGLKPKQLTRLLALLRSQRSTLAIVLVLTLPMASSALPWQGGYSGSSHGESLLTWEHVKDALGILGVWAAFGWALWRFGRNRGLFTFMDMDLQAKVVSYVRQDNKDLLLVSLVVGLKNRGLTKIQARRRYYLRSWWRFRWVVRGQLQGRHLNTEKYDLCEHAGTLKVRRALEGTSPTQFDWYSLEPVGGIVTWKDKEKESQSHLEQVDYLGEFEDDDPAFRDDSGTYKDVDFWLEPKETDQCSVMIWLNPGTYAVKAYFLGKRSQPAEEDEYWSCTRLFNLKPPDRAAENESRKTP